MDEVQRYLFDLNGFLVLEDVLPPAAIAAGNEAIERCADQSFVRTGDQLLSAGSAALAGRHGRRDLVGMLGWPAPWNRPFRDMMDHDAVLPVLGELLGDGFRLDHVYGIGMTEGAEGFVLHGGGTAANLTSLFQFHNGKMRCGLTVVAWQLTDAGPDDGGFCCIPGSHKANYPCPRSITRVEQDAGCVRPIPLRAGSVLIFTEALTHGTLPWRGSHERRTILFKYSPGPMTWAREAIPPELHERLDEFTPRQRALLEPPYEWGRPRVA